MSTDTHPCGCPLYVHPWPLVPAPMPDELRALIDYKAIARMRRARQRARVRAIAREQRAAHFARRAAS